MTHPAALPAIKRRGSRLAGSAYWAMMRRIVVIAGCIDAAWIPLYSWFGSPTLALLNLVSVAMYTASFLLIGRRRNLAAVTLIWLEVLAHSAIGSLFIGWDSGFHYFLLLFIPAIVVGSARRYAIPLVLALFAFYIGLDALCDAYAPLNPLSALGLRFAKWLNIGLIFGLFFSMARFYRATVLKAERRLLEQATTDPLTGMANRSHFHSRAVTELARCKRSGEPVTLVLGDIDLFKRINDESGHDAGDKVLVKVAELMAANLRDIDVLARWGGEEFLVLLPNSDTTNAVAVGERLRRAVAEASIEVDGRRIPVTMSFGVAQVDGEGDLQPATVRADQALYSSKEGGRNRVTLASGQACELSRHARGAQQNFLPVRSTM